MVGSIQELEELTGAKVTDIHRHFIDHLTIPSRQGKGDLKRVEDVFDCWFESGSMPYAQVRGRVGGWGGRGVEVWGSGWGWG